MKAGADPLQRLACWGFVLDAAAAAAAFRESFGFLMPPWLLLVLCLRIIRPLCIALTSLFGSLIAILGN